MLCEEVGANAPHKDDRRLDFSPQCPGRLSRVGLVSFKRELSSERQIFARIDRAAADLYGIDARPVQDDTDLRKVLFAQSVRDV